jgi:hypothetical protein
MTPTKLGKGIIGVRDLGLLVYFLGNNMRGGGIRCLETRTSCDYSDYWYEGSSGYILLDKSILAKNNFNWNLYNNKIILFGNIKIIAIFYLLL